MRLYELTEQYNSALENMQSLDMDQQTINDTMEGLSGELEVKAKNVGAYYLNLESDANQMKDAIKNMQARLKAVTNKADFFKEYLRDNMERSGIDKIECPQFKITLREASKVLEINAPKAIFEDFKEIVETVKIDKVGLKKWMIEKGLTEVEGAEIVDGKRGLLIK